jgi:hypothetical protein
LNASDQNSAGKQEQLRKSGTLEKNLIHAPRQAPDHPFPQCGGVARSWLLRCKFLTQAAPGTELIGENRQPDAALGYEANPTGAAAPAGRTMSWLLRYKSGTQNRHRGRRYGKSIEAQQLASHPNLHTGCYGSRPNTPTPVCVPT